MAAISPDLNTEPGGAPRGTVVKVHRCRQHPFGKGKGGCPDCAAWWRYTGALRRQAVRDGTLQRMVSVELVRAHVEKLLDRETGGWSQVGIAERSGLSVKTIQWIRISRMASVQVTTWDALRVLEPGAAPRLTARQVDATEVRRTLQGLVAQGFSFVFMARVIGTTRQRVNQWASDRCSYVHPETLRTVRSLRDRLGPYDITVMAEPLAGMSRRAAKHARKVGWVPLIAWRGLDITDPAEVPRTGSARNTQEGQVGEEEPLPQMFPFVDDLIKMRCEEARDVIQDTDTAANERAFGYITPLGKVRRFEAYCAAGYATSLGLSAVRVGELLGYHDEDAGERAASRMRRHMREARERLDQLAAGNQPDPAWCRRRPNGNGLNDVGELLTALLAIQPAPYGPGWTVLELADRAGVEEGNMRQFLTYATRRMDVEWAPRNRSQRDRTVPASCTQAA